MVAAQCRQMDMGYFVYIFYPLPSHIRWVEMWHEWFHLCMNGHEPTHSSMEEVKGLRHINDHFQSETHWFLSFKTKTVWQNIFKELCTQNSLRNVCLIFFVLWGELTDQREWFIFFKHHTKVVTLLARSIHLCMIFMCSFEQEMLLLYFVAQYKMQCWFNLPLFTVLVSPMSFPSAFVVLLLSFRSRFISKLLLLSSLCRRFCSSLELLLFSSEFCSDCFVSEFSCSCSFSFSSVRTWNSKDKKYSLNIFHSTN